MANNPRPMVLSLDSNLNVERTNIYLCIIRMKLIYEGSSYYENTVSIKPTSEREHIWIELCTDDKNEALLWSNNPNEYSSVTGKSYRKKKLTNILSLNGKM